MAQKVLSIYIGNTVIRICEIVKDSQKSLTVNSAVEISTPPNCVEDGYINDIYTLADVIKSAASAKSMTAKKVVFTISSNRIVNKELLIPYVRNKRRIKDIINANATDYFPVRNVSEYVFAHSVIELVRDKEGKKYRVNAAAVPALMLEHYYELAAAMRMNLLEIDYISNSINQILQLQHESGTQMILQVEKDASYVNIIEDGLMVMQRSITYGRNQICEYLADIIHEKEETVEKYMKSIEKMDEIFTDEEYLEALFYLINSIERIMEYHKVNYAGKPVGGIKIFGTVSNIAGLDEMLEQEIGIPVQYLSVLKGITIKRKLKKAAEVNILDFMANIGAILAPFDLHIDYHKNGVRRDDYKYLYVGLAAACVVAVTMVTIVFISVYAKSNERLSLESKVAELSEAESLYQRYLEAQKEYQTMEEFYDSTRSNTEYLSVLIQDLELVMPAGMGITSLSVTDGEVAFSAICSRKEQAAELIVQLKGLAYVNDVFIETLSEVQDQEGNRRVSVQLRFLLASEGTEVEDNSAMRRSTSADNAGDVLPEAEDMP